MNDLDRAIMAVQRSKAGLSDLYRALSGGELWFLVRFHPELEGEALELKNGSPLPFAMIDDGKDSIVPLFSSEARLEEGLKKGRVPARTFSAASLPAIQVLDMLGKAGLRAIINKSCATGEARIPPNLMRDLAHGKVLTPIPVEAQARERGKVRILNPADYPTHLIQPAFEFMRRHPNFRAAWIFGLTQGGQPEVTVTRSWQMLILMQPRETQLAHDLTLAVQGARSKDDELGIGLVDENDATFVENLFRQAPAFFTAPDHPRPPDPLPPEPGNIAS